MWSKNSIPSILQPFRISFVASMSFLLGVGSPLGWLCISINLLLLLNNTFLNISFCDILHKLNQHLASYVKLTS